MSQSLFALLPGGGECLGGRSGTIYVLFCLPEDCDLVLSPLFSPSCSNAGDCKLEAFHLGKCRKTAS